MCSSAHCYERWWKFGISSEDGLGFPTFFSGLLWTHSNTLNTLAILYLCHPQLFLFSEQLLTGRCFPCNVYYSAIAYHACLLKQQCKTIRVPLSYSENSLLKFYLFSQLFKMRPFFFGHILFVLLLVHVFQLLVRILGGSRLPRPLCLPCFLHSPSRWMVIKCIKQNHSICINPNGTF